MDGINKYTITMYKMIESYMKSKDTKNILLEPLSCLIKLVILSQKIQGTKISIYNNSILFHEPSITQGVLRTYQGDSRDDLHNLCFPIMIALKWYPKDREMG